MESNISTYQSAENKLIAEVSPVLHMTRVPNLSYGHERFFDFISQFYEHAQEGIKDTAINDFGFGATGRPTAKQVLLLMGDPNSGKTFINRTIKQSIIPRLSTELPLFQGKLFNRHVQERNWEQDGEKRAKEKGLIKSKEDESFSREELNHAENELIDAIAEGMRDPFSAVVQVELPGGIAGQIDNTMQVYRPLGARVVRELVEHQGKFQQLNYDVWGAAFVGGPFLRTMRKGRDKIRRVKSLEKAEEVAHLYGLIRKDAQLTSEYWQELKNGAYLKQFKVIDACINDLMEAINDTPEMVNARKIADSYQYDSLTQLLLSTSKGMDFSHPWIQGARWQNFLERAIGLDSERAFIGFYNPLPSQSGLNADDVAKLRADLVR